ncbi:MAG: MATE family efflux transporter [Burkholderiales bacterium]
MTILSLLAFLGLADLGVGSTLVTAISRAVGAGDTRRVRTLHANGLVAVGLFALLLLTVAAGLALSNVADAVFPKSDLGVRQEATAALAAFVAMFAFTVPVTLIFKVQLALQKGHVANHWQSVASVFNFVGGVAACVMGAGVPWIIAGLLAGTVLCGLAASVQYALSATDARPTFGDVGVPLLGQLLRESSLYLGLQVIFVITYAVDTLIVARALGASEVSAYALAERLFSIVAVAVAVTTGPLWAAYGEALGSRDHAWARRCLRTSLWRIGLVSGAMAAGLFALSQPLIGLLGAGEVTISLGLAAAMAVWRVVEALGSGVAVYLFATRALRVVLLTGGVTALVSLGAKLLVVSRFEAMALPIVTTVCFVLFSLLPCCYYIHRMWASESESRE